MFCRLTKRRGISSTSQSKTPHSSNSPLQPLPLRPENQHNELKRRNRTAQDLRHHLPPRCREGHPHREAAAFWRGHPDRRGEGPKAQRPAIPIAIGTGRTKKGARQLRLGPPARHPGSQPGQRGSPLGGLPNQQPVLLRPGSTSSRRNFSTSSPAWTRPRS